MAPVRRTLAGATLLFVLAISKLHVYKTMQQGVCSMSKYTGHYTSREQEVLDSPDYYILRVFTHQIGWVDSVPFTAAVALKRFNNIRALPKNYRVVPYAARKFGDEVRLAAVTPAYLSALTELKAAQ